MKFSGAVLEWSPHTSRVFSFAWVRTVRQNFYLLSLGTKWTPILVFWLEEKKSDLIHQPDRKYFMWKYFHSTKFLKLSIVFVLFGNLNNHNCMAQPVFVPKGKDLMPQNYLLLFPSLQLLPATPFWTFCCQAGLGSKTQSNVIQHLIDTLEHKTWLLLAFRCTAEVVSLVTM